MPRRGITRDEVAQAGLALKAGGHPVTTLNVRRELGRGSYSTIRAHLEDLGAKEKGRPRADDAVPPTVHVLGNGFIQKVWATAREHTRRSEETSKRPLQRRIGELVVELARAGELRERLEYEAVQLRHDLRTARMSCDNLTRQLADARQELAVEVRLRERCEGAATESCREHKAKPLAP
ncbi:MAG: DNA-binding protein [Proteobacteria bacterium]|jgi:predicted RNase H-like nuclease (RuvC/YqgF family)|nr:DNA-binding protein [Pseudomonadota bacterium]